MRRPALLLAVLFAILSALAACTTTQWTFEGTVSPTPPTQACAPGAICSLGFRGVGDGPMLGASLGSPLGMAYGPGGKLYIADTAQNRIRVIDTAGVISTLGGT